MSQCNAIKPNKIRGFTLIELLVVMSIMSILLAIALPSFQDTIERSVTNSQIKLLMTTLNLARSEAIKRGTNVAICSINDDGNVDCDAQEWQDGWIVFVDANGDADGDVGSIDAGDTIIRVFRSLGSNSTLTFTVDLFEYDSMGFSATGGTQEFELIPSSGNTDNARCIVISLSGRGRRVEGVCP